MISIIYIYVCVCVCVCVLQPFPGQILHNNVHQMHNVYNVSRMGYHTCCAEVGSKWAKTWHRVSKHSCTGVEHR